MATFADSNRVSLRGIKEDNANWGVTPITGKSREIRITSSSLALSKETTMSEELRADRMVSSIVETAATTEGDINFEFSAGSQDDYLQAFLLGAWTRPMTFDAFKGQVVSIPSTSTIRIAGGDFTAYFTAGRYVKTEGFTTPANNGYFSIASVAFVANATVITIVQTTLVVETGKLSGRVMDANDVIIRASTAIRLGTAGADTVDSNGTNAFASAIAAGQLNVGQVIFIEGPSVQTATVTFTGVATINDTLIVSDGLNIKTFIAGTDYAVGATVTEVAANLATAINVARTKGLVEVDATSALGVVTIRNLHVNADGTAQAGSLTEVTDSGAVIAVTDFAGEVVGARGFYTVVSATDDVITVDSTPPTVATGTFTIKGSMVKNPGGIEDITPQSFSIETAFNDVNQFMLHDGVRIGTYSLEISSGAIVTGTMSVAGKATKNYSVTQLADAVKYDVLQSTDTEVMNSTTNVGTIFKDGSVLSTAIQSITIEGDATLRNQMAVSSKFPRGIGTGRFQLSGSLTAYFENLEMWNDFEQHNTISLRFNFIDLDNNVYYFTIPALKITSDPVAPGGIDQDITEEMEWMAFRDQATGCMLQVDRFSSVYPV